MLSTFQLISIALTVLGAAASAILWVTHRFAVIRDRFDQRNDKYQTKNQQQHSVINSRLQKVESEQGKYVLHTECSEHRQRLRDAIDRQA